MRALCAVGLVLVLVLGTANCSIVLVHGPPSPGENDYDPTGRYPDGVPCTSGRVWPVVDVAMALAALITTATYDEDQTDDKLDGIASTLAAAVSAWIGFHRTSACRDAEAATAATPPAASVRR